MLPVAESSVLTILARIPYAISGGVILNRFDLQETLSFQLLML